MIRRFRTAALCFTLAMLQISFVLAQGKATPTPIAPIPPQILAAKKVFIANAGGDEMAPNEPVFSGGPDRAYNQFYAAIKSWGRFEIVNSPADADLLLEIREYVFGLSPQFQLKICDPKTNAMLWGFNIHSEFGAGQANSDRNFDSAVGHLTIDLRMLVTPSQPAVQ
jgi:hypothetical protein